MSPPPQVAVLLETSREYGRGMLRGIVRYARLHGPWTFSVTPGHFEQHLPRIKGLGVKGIIARISSLEVARAISEAGLPAVTLEASFEEFVEVNPSMGICEVRSDSPGIARMAVEHLVERGFRHLAFCGLPGCLWSEVREEEFCRQANKSGITAIVYQQPGAKRNRRWDRERTILIDWLHSLPKPVGLMACNDDRGRRVLEACAIASIQVPDEVAVVGVDNDEVVCELTTPPLSSVALDLDTAGYEAAALLDEMMSGHFYNFHEVPVKPLWVSVRRSTDVIALEDRIVSKALRFIRDNATHLIDVSDVVTQTDCSRRALERRFSQAIERTIHEEITRCRLKHAKQLLLETDLSVESVARAAGFSGQKPLFRAFRLKENMTPATFRRNNG